MLEAKKLNFGIKNIFNKEISFKVSKGQILAIQGPSGSGKTTLLSTISGFIEHFSGELTWNKEDMLSKNPWDRPFSILFQEGNLFDHLNIQMNIQIGISPSGKVSEKKTKEIKNTLIELGIDNLADRLPKEISGGQQQRAALARTIIRKHPVLLLDEPFSSLDRKTRMSAINLISKLTKNYKLTVLLVTHDNEDAKILNAKNIYL